MAIDIHEETNLRLTRRTFLGKTVRGCRIARAGISAVSITHQCCGN